MIPVTQTVLGYPNGNCYAACIASLLEIPLDECPVTPAAGDFNDVWEKWLRERGLGRIIFTHSPQWIARGWTIMVGRSPRELVMEDGEYAKHAVIGLDGELVHDPHPDRTFFAEYPIDEVEIIYALDPRNIDTCAEVTAR